MSALVFAMFGWGNRARIWAAAGSNRDTGIWLLGKGCRTTYPLTVVCVSGSKIWLPRNVLPSGSGVVETSVGLSAEEKLPFRYAAVGTVFRPLVVSEF